MVVVVGAMMSPPSNSLALLSFPFLCVFLFFFQTFFPSVVELYYALLLCFLTHLPALPVTVFIASFGLIVFCLLSFVCITRLSMPGAYSSFLLLYIFFFPVFSSSTSLWQEIKAFDDVKLSSASEQQLQQY